MSRERKIGALTIEEIQTLYFDDKSLKVPSYKLWRGQRGGSRFYFDPDDETGKLFPSITSVISAAHPKSIGLHKWEIQKALEAGYARAGSDYARERANFGTFMHILFADFFCGLDVVLQEIGERYELFLITKEDVPAANAYQLKLKHERELQKNFLAFLRWVLDYKVKPLFVECLLKSDGGGFASAVDLGCEITMPIAGCWGATYASGARKGEPKKTKEDQTFRCIVDFKSGEGLYDEYDLQGTGYRQLVEENFPGFFGEPALDELNIEVQQPEPFFIWRPKDWKTEPGYHFTERQPHPDWDTIRDLGVRRRQVDSSSPEPVYGGHAVTRFNLTEESLAELMGDVPLIQLLTSRDEEDE